MPDQPVQSFDAHRRYVTGYHIVLTLFVFVLLVWQIIQLVRNFGVGSAMNVLLVVSLIMAAFYARAFATANQDRIIRLEEQLRLQRLLPDDLQGRIGDLKTSQFVGLRFASDGEVAELTRKVLDEGIEGREPIKQMIKEWRADHQRV